MILQELATKFAGMFEYKKRDNDQLFVVVKDEFEDNIQLKNLIKDIHDQDNMFPDDYKYLFIVEALEALSEHSDSDNIVMEADIYYSDLLKWVGSHAIRAHYVNEAVEEIGYTDFYQSLTIGQLREIDEVLYLVKLRLECIIEQEDY